MRRLLTLAAALLLLAAVSLAKQSVRPQPEAARPIARVTAPEKRAPRQELQLPSGLTGDAGAHSFAQEFYPAHPDHSPAPAPPNQASARP